MGNRWIDHIVMFPLYLIYSNTAANFLSSQVSIVDYPGENHNDNLK